MNKLIRIVFILTAGVVVVFFAVWVSKTNNSIGRLSENEIEAFVNNDSLKLASVNYLLENSDDKYTKLSIKKLSVEIPDKKFVSKDYLFENIELAISQSAERLKRREYSKQQFLEYVLPYRLRFEIPEDWRNYAIDKFDTCYDEDIFIHASNINDLLRTRFAYSLSVKNNQRFSKMHKNGKGACDEMSDMAAFAMRANGIPVAVEFARWANIVGGHQWNSLMLDDKHIPFMGIESNPNDSNHIKMNNNPLEIITGIYKKPAKVYRKTFNEPAFINSDFNHRKLINESNFVDVTKEYFPDSKKLVIQLPDDSKNGKYFFLCVYQVDNWAPIAYSKANNNTVVFNDVRPQNIFALKVLENEELKYYQNPFTFDSLAHVQFLDNNPQTTADVKLAFFNSSERELIRSFNEIGYEQTELIWEDILIENKTGKIENDSIYQLFYWDNKWILAAEALGRNDSVFFKNVPKNAVYKIEIPGADMSRRFRCFTVEEKNTQNWW
jgi:hypothetical protein